MTIQPASRSTRIQAPHLPETAIALGVTVVIPVFNEAAGLTAVLDALRSGSKLWDFSHQIIIVDDGSEDHCAGAVEDYPDILLLQHRAQRGYGAALKTGIRQAQFPWICIMDGDGTYPLEGIPTLVRNQELTGAAMVIGARKGPGTAIPWIRRPAKWALNRLAIFIAGEKIPDLNSGLRLFRRDLVTRIFNILPDGFSFTSTLTLALLTNGYRVGFIPIKYHPRTGRSKIRPVSDTLNFLQTILRMALYFAPLRVFLPLSAAMFILAVVWALVTRFFVGELADVSTLVLAVAGIQVALMGMLAEVIIRRIPGPFS